jgi:hypothetical protein
MEPALWGPGLWHLLFAITWNCKGGDAFATLKRIVLVHVPLLLPCQLCQNHYVRNNESLRRRLGEPNDPSKMFEWLYYLKDEVNKTLRTRSVALAHFRARYDAFGARLDDVCVADTLLMVAIGKEDDGDDDVFVEMCHAMAPLLPLPADSELRRCLAQIRAPIVDSAYRASKRTRVEHGLTFPTLAQVRLSLA